MTGKELIIYILAHDLEDKPVFEEGKFLDFMTVEEAAVKLGVGCSSVRALTELGKLNSITIGNTLFLYGDILEKE